MARFDVYDNPDADERRFIPFLLDVQNDFIRGMETCVMVPLWKAGTLHDRLEQLHPEFEVAGQRVVMDTPSLGAVPVRGLRRVVDNLSSRQLDIQNALDTLLGSY